MAGSSDLRRTLRRAADRGGPGTVFLCAKAIEIEGAFLAFGDAFSVYYWGTPWHEAKRALVTVPRSLRRYFGRVVPAMPSGKGRREKRPRQWNRHEAPITEADFGE